jgi:hypothetical protein
MRPPAKGRSGLAPRRNQRHRVTPISTRSYAVGFKPGICLDAWPNAPPAGRKILFFFTKMLHIVQHFREKDKKYTMLPPASLPFTG